MGDKTTIGWTDATWSPVTGCTKVSPGCAKLDCCEVSQSIASDVVSANKSAWTLVSIKIRELRFAATGTLHYGIFFTWPLPLVVLMAMKHVVVKVGGYDFQILGAVICLISIKMMNNLTLLKWAAKYLFGDEPMFVNVTSAICLRVIRSLDKNVPIRGDGTSTLPIRVLVGA